MEPHPITDIIRRRRSLKPAAMRPDPIDRAHLELLVENAVWAPTHGLTEPWRFYIFQGAARQELADTLQTLYRLHTPADSIRPEKLEKLGRNPLLAPVVIAIGMVPDPAGKIPELEEVEAVACAVHNMHLTATALGLGAFWSSPAIIYTQEMNAFLHLEPNGKCLGLFYLGWPQEGSEPESRRSPWQSKCHWFGDLPDLEIPKP